MSIDKCNKKKIANKITSGDVPEILTLLQNLWLGESFRAVFSCVFFVL